MSFVREPGDLSRTPLAAILLELWNLRLDGELAVDHDGGRSRVFFRDGVPVGAQAFVGFQPLGQILLAQGAIGIEDLDRSLAEMARTGRPQGEILVELGAVDRATLGRALAAQQAAYLSGIAGLAAGAYRFDPGATLPAWTRDVPVAPHQAIREALAAPQAAALVESALRAAPGEVALAPGYAEATESFGWGEAERALVGRLATPARVEAILDGAPVPPERARADVAALLLLGLAEPAGGAVDLAEIATPAAPAPPSATAAPPSVRPVPAAAPTPPARRGDPEEARARRQRLLARAMENMGVGPRPGAPPRPEPHRPEAPRAEAHHPGARTAGEGGEATAPEGGRVPGTPVEEATRRALLAILPRAGDPDLFARLGLRRGASPEEVKTAYLELVRRFHPDRCSSPAFADLQGALRDLLAGLNEAYSTLTDGARRRDYLAQAARGGTATGTGAAEAARIDAEKAEACLRTRDLARARTFLESAVRADRRPAYLAALAAVLLADPRAPDRTRARAVLDEAMKDPSCDRAFALAAGMARVDGDEPRAERLYREALRANPRNAEAARAVKELQARARNRAEDRTDAKK